MEFSFTLESVIGGHHVYLQVCINTFIGEILSLSAEVKVEMKMIPYAVAVSKDSAVVDQ